MNDKELVKFCLKGSQQAQKELYNRFAPAMLGVCYRYTKSLTDAEDVLQDGFVKVFKNLSSFRSEGELSAWIRRIVVNTALNYLKQHKRYSGDLSFDEVNLHPVSSENPQVQLQTKELVELVRQLPTGCQTIFNLHAIEGFTHVEIGEMLGIHEGTARSQYARARAIMVQWIEKRNGDFKMQKYARK